MTVPSQQPYVVLTHATGVRGLVTIQFDPALSRFGILFPGQQPNLDRRHASAVVMVGQFEPSWSVFFITVPGQHPCLDLAHMCTVVLVPV